MPRETIKHAACWWRVKRLMNAKFTCKRERRIKAHTRQAYRWADKDISQALRSFL